MTHLLLPLLHHPVAEAAVMTPMLMTSRRITTRCRLPRQGEDEAPTELSGPDEPGEIEQRGKQPLTGAGSTWTRH